MSADSRLSAGELRIIAAVMAQVKMPGDIVDASIPFLASVTGMSQRNVIRGRSNLVGHGYLVTAGKGEHGTGQYSLTDGVEGVTSVSGVTAVSGDTDVISDLTPVSPHAAKIHINETGYTGVMGDVPSKKMSEKSKTMASKKSPVPPDSQTWRDWVDACRQCGRPDPAPSPAAVKAAATLSTWVSDPDELFSIMIAYLQLDDPWIRRQGYQLALLANHRFEAAREAATKPVMGNEALDALGAQMIAEEKRRHELGIPDWEECPA